MVLSVVDDKKKSHSIVNKTELQQRQSLKLFKLKWWYVTYHFVSWKMYRILQIYLYFQLHSKWLAGISAHVEI